MSKDTIDKLNRLEFFYWCKPTKTPEVLKQDKEQVEKDFALIRKELKALEIIKKKGLTINDLYWLIKGDYKKYRKNLERLYSGIEEEHLQRILKTEEEFNLLKEVLKDESA